MGLRKCEKCGVERNTMGFNLHYSRCKGTEHLRKIENPRLPKNFPGFATAISMLNDLNAEIVETKKQQRVLEEQEKDSSEECNCIGYIGKSFSCQRHKPKVECPYCHCIDVERNEGYMDPCQTYRCGMCGHAYMRQMTTGEYLYER